MRAETAMLLGAVTLVATAFAHHATIDRNAHGKGALTTACGVMIGSFLFLVFSPIQDLIALTAQIVITALIVPEWWHSYRYARRVSGAMVWYALVALAYSVHVFKETL